MRNKDLKHIVQYQTAFSSYFELCEQPSSYFLVQGRCALDQLTESMCEFDALYPPGKRSALNEVAETRMIGLHALVYLKERLDLAERMRAPASILKPGVREDHSHRMNAGLLASLLPEHRVQALSFHTLYLRIAANAEQVQRSLGSGDFETMSRFSNTVAGLANEIEWIYKSSRRELGDLQQELECYPATLRHYEQIPGLEGKAAEMKILQAAKRRKCESLEALVKLQDSITSKARLVVNNDPSSL